MIRRQPRSTRTDTLFPDTMVCRSGERFACSPFLNLMAGCKRYGRFMLSRTQRNVPRLTFHIARINRVSRSEEHTSELQSLMRISYAVFSLKKKKTNYNKSIQHPYFQHTQTHTDLAVIQESHT